MKEKDEVPTQFYRKTDTIFISLEDFPMPKSFPTMKDLEDFSHVLKKAFYKLDLIGIVADGSYEGFNISEIYHFSADMIQTSLWFGLRTKILAKSTDQNLLVDTYLKNWTEDDELEMNEQLRLRNIQ